MYKHVKTFLKALIFFMFFATQSHLNINLLILIAEKLKKNSLFSYKEINKKL